MTIVALYSIKGGVGKTAAAVNLAFLAARAGIRTLICDLDPQSSTTFYFRVKPILKSKLKKVIKGTRALSESIKATDFDRLDLLPADLSLRNLDLLLDSRSSRFPLGEILAPLKSEYDLIFLDAPPNLTLLSENIFRVANFVLVPIVPTTLSERTWEQLNHFFVDQDLARQKLWGFFSMVDGRKTLHRQTMTSMFAGGGNLLQSKVPFLSEIERMGLTREPVPHTYPRGHAAQAYLSLWSELRHRVKKESS